MMIKVIAVIIGVLLIIAGTYYIVKEKNDPESRKIYSIVIVVGAVLAIGGLLKLFVF